MALSIDGITSALATANQYSSTKTDSITSGLKDLNTTTATDDELMDACKSFEAYFVQQLYKEMQKTVDKSEEEKNQYQDYFGDMMLEQYANNTVENQGVGIAQMLYESMKKNQT